MGGMWSGPCGISRGGAGVPVRWWLVLWVLLAGLWVSGEADPLWATSPTDEAGEGVGPVTDDHCSGRLHRSDGTCRACADRFYYRTSRGCVHRTGPHPLDYLCENEGESYYSSVMGCRQVYCPQPPHGDSGRDANGYCQRPPPTTAPPPTTTEAPPPPPGAPRNVSVTAGMGSLTVSWQRAASGGEPDDWEIHYSYREGVGVSARTFSDFHTVAGKDVPAGGVTLSDLKPGMAYAVKVRAKSDTAGYSSYSSTVTVTTLAAVTLIGLEVTQGLQDWEGSIDLVRGKRTVVRAFLEPFSGQDTKVTIRLEAIRKHGSTETVVATAYPVNASNYWEPSLGITVAEFTAQPDAAGRRHELNASANFVLSDSRWFGSRNYVPNGRYSITYRLVASEAIICKEAINPDKTCEASLSFKAVKQPWVSMVGIEFAAQDAPDDVDLEEQARRIESLMPIPRLDYELRTIRLLIPPPTDNDDLEELLDELQTARANHNSSSAYLGVFEGSAPGGLAFVLSNVATWGIDNNNKYADSLTNDRNFGSHEFGHIIGGQHSAYKDSSSDEMRTVCTGDPIEGEVEEYPHLLEVTVGRDRESWAALGPLHPPASADAEVWGLDTRFVQNGPDNLAVINPREVFSLMSYCHPNGRLGVISQGVWIDKYHHSMFIDYINDRDWDLGVGTRAEGDAVPSRRIAIQGRYKVSSGGVSGSSAGEVVVRPVFALPPESRLIAPPGEHLLEFFDGDGKVLTSVSFGTKTSTGDSVWKSWLVPVTEPSGWASYRISKPAATGAAGAGNAPPPVLSRTVLVEVTRSANAPAVSVTAPAAGQVFSGDEVSFSWTGSDTDGDSLSYDVAYSYDGGASYRTIAAGNGFTSLAIDRKWLAGSTTARVKVTALDGTRTASAESPVFTVSQNAPRVLIHSPAANVIGGHGALILDASAYDTEDGRLDSSAIQWASGTDGNLGSGGYVVVYPEDLTPGLHWLTATVTDSSGTTGFAEVVWSNAAPIEPSPPEPPAGAAAAGGNRSVTIRWDSPVAWLVTTYYQYRYRPASGAWTQWASLPPGDQTHTISGLSSGARYEIEMRTATDTGVSDPVGLFASTAATVPAAPGGLTAVGGDGWVDLSWDNPGDSSITGYYIRERPSFDDGWWCWTWMYSSGKDTVSYRVSRLSSGTAYRMQIRAVNATGTGPAAEVSAATSAAASPPAAAPAAPGGLVGAGADRAIALSWKNPADSSIIEYQFREKPVGVTDWRCWRRIHSSTNATTSYTMNWLTNGLRYQVQLRALNAAGAGNPSQTTATPTPGP